MREKVVNTRVSKELYEKISEKARKNRTSISNLVRTLVEDTIEVYDDISDIIDKEIKDSFDEKGNDVVAFQEVSLAKETPCSNCETAMLAGSKAFYPTRADGTRLSVICPKCKDKVI